MGGIFKKIGTFLNFLCITTENACATYRDKSPPPFSLFLGGGVGGGGWGGGGGEGGLCPFKKANETYVDENDVLHGGFHNECVESLCQVNQVTPLQVKFDSILGPTMKINPGVRTIFK